MVGQSNNSDSSEMNTLRTFVITIFTDVRYIQVWNVLVIIMSVLTGYEHIVEFLKVFTSNNLMSSALELEEDIALIIVAYGVLLEERHVLLNRLSKDAAKTGEKLTELFERYGAYILMTGLFMEMIDQAFEPILSRISLEPVGIGIMVILDIVTILLMLRFSWFCKKVGKLL